MIDTHLHILPGIDEGVFMSPIRIGVIAFDWYSFEPRVLRLVQAAKDAGHEVDVIALRQPHEKRYEVCNDVHVYRMPMNRFPGDRLITTVLSWCLFLFLAGIMLTWLHLRRPYDVIHVHNMPDFLVFCALFPKLLGARVILDVQDVTPELMTAKSKGRLRRITTRVAIWQEHLSVAFADHVLTVGAACEERLLQRGVLKENLTVIRNGADPHFFPPSRRCPSPIEFSEERPFILMHHGTIVERAGLDTAIRALALARRVIPHVRLDIQGRDEHLELLPSLKQLAQELGVSDHVVFTSGCPHDKVVDFVVHGDVGLIPSRCDGYMDLMVLPTKAYEFAWMQRPVIASDTYGLHSMFRPESIMFCNSTKPESFAEAIIDLYQHPEKRSQMVANAYEDYLPYRWELEAVRYQQLLTSLLDK